MIVILHVIIALASIAFVTYAFTSPTNKKLYTSYGLIALTLVSGVYMTVSSPALMLHSCIAGVAYISLVSVATIVLKAKIARLSLNTL